MGNRFRSAGLALIAAMLPITAEAVPGVGHVAWVAPNRAWTAGVGLVDATADGIPDVVAVAGDRSASYQQCLVPPGNPAPTLHQLTERLLAPGNGLTLLDGRDGTTIATTPFTPGTEGVIGIRSERSTIEVVEDLYVGDVDGNGSTDVLVLRASVAKDGSSATPRTTLFDARTLTPLWDVEGEPSSRFALRRFTPLAIGGSPRGLVSSAMTEAVTEGNTLHVTLRGAASLVDLSQGLATLATLPGNVIWPIVVPHGDGFRLVSQSPRITLQGQQAEVAVDARAFELTIDGDDVSLDALWSRTGGGGSPAVVAGDTLYVGRERPELERGSIVAIDLATGDDRWTRPIDVGPRGGSLLATDLDGDGTTELVASPAFPAVPGTETVLRGGLHAQLVALDGADGGLRWVSEVLDAKFRAWELTTAEIDGDAQPELVASFTTQDGFATCAQPSDDPGMVGVFDLTSGSLRCRFHTDRFPVLPRAANLDRRPGQELIVGTIGGSTTAFTATAPACLPG